MIGVEFDETHELPDRIPADVGEKLVTYSPPVAAAIKMAAHMDEWGDDAVTQFNQFHDILATVDPDLLPANAKEDLLTTAAEAFAEQDPYLLHIDGEPVDLYQLWENTADRLGIDTGDITPDEIDFMDVNHLLDEDARYDSRDSEPIYDIDGDGEQHQVEENPYAERGVDWYTALLHGEPLPMHERELTVEEAQEKADGFTTLYAADNSEPLPSREIQHAFRTELAYSLSADHSYGAE